MLNGVVFIDLKKAFNTTDHKTTGGVSASLKLFIISNKETTKM